MEHTNHWLKFMSPFILIWVAICSQSCDDGDKPASLPQVTTAAISAPTATSATGGGSIVSNGNDRINACGLAFSSTNESPTIEDDTTLLTVQDGAFTSRLKSLIPSTTYFIRAYATNSAGTAYGDVVSFSTGNAPPEAIDITITGDARISLTLSASYKYNDIENDLESGTTFQWYSTDDASGNNEMAIPGATEKTYRIQTTDEFKLLRIGISPKAMSGTSSGTETKSDFVGPIPEAETVTFVYNGETVTYGVIISSVTGKKWMDRNIGATRIATAYNDYWAYGDLFQWGRGADGHQLMKWTDSSTGVPTNGKTDELSLDDTPDHGLFIVNPITAFPADWRSAGNNNLWQAPNYTNNPCPDGWHIPTKTEFESENIESLPKGFDQLKLVASGWRRLDDSAIAPNSPPGSVAFYWVSTVSNDNYADYFVFHAYTGPGNAFWRLDQRGDAMSCRCTKN